MLTPMNEPNKYDYRQMYHDLDIAKSKVFMGKRSAFFAPIMCSLEFMWSEGVETAATDGKAFWWNPVDFLRCDIPERVSTIMHEMWHVALLHNLRRGTREGKPWNYACDIVINRNMKRDGYYIGPDWLLVKEFDKIELEEDIYKELMKNNTKIEPTHCNHDHADVDDSEVDASVITDIVVKAVTNAKLEGEAGQIPGGTEELLDHFLSPVVPWEIYLARWMSDLQNHDYTWSKPNRRYPDMYLPSKYEDDGRLEHLIYFQDVSGSITGDEIKRFNSELKYVWDEFKPQKMTIVQFDTRIQKIDEFKEGDEFAEVKIIGRGGTCLRCVREKIIELRPTAAIIFSDMQVAPMESLPINIPILWVATNSRGVTPPFGEIIHVKV